jgi:serine/threonine-protein kinase ULK/ATG1
MYSGNNIVINNPYVEEAIKQEMTIHFSLNHPNIVKVVDVIHTPKNYYIVQEYCSGGSLKKVFNILYSF